MMSGTEPNPARPYESTRMQQKISDSEMRFLATIAEHRVLTVSQLAVLVNKSKLITRKQVSAIQDAGLIETAPLFFGHARGRPERVISLANRGVSTLKAADMLPQGVAEDRAKSIEQRLLAHQLLINWFRIKLAEIPRVIPSLTTDSLAPTSPFVPAWGDGRPILADRVRPDPRLKKTIDFMPDGVCCIKDVERGKALLFFLEVDMGSEAIASRSRPESSVRHKITTYQAYFHRGGYKRFGQRWECDFNGFRLLIVTTSAGRLEALCRLARETPPSDFVWLTDQDRLIGKGLSERIWTRGGRQQAALESILGSAAVPSD